ncbi:2-aminoethylphosphonate--pyruvate transaminase [Archangium violaceum]|uniref:2-aminoethylphosphonate--pyruvate transaminase n=1 Tax=Archangium violaceum TaxID=83451 RepID=UPI00193B147B|nr:2-aminoethylphosphonate--pyruvate transaminase [Archangium violaceum]QRK08019.1 2-aminoethylphosphonate--pyruvate transaminase [Archangium violaceum]
MLLLIPGPVQTDPRVRAAMTADIAPWDLDFRAEYAAIRAKVTEIAGGIPGRHATLPLQGSGHFIVEAAIRTFIPAGGCFLLPMNGTYAARIHRLASEAGRVPVTLELPDTRPVTEAELDAAFAAHPEVTHLCAVVSETGTGIINDPEVLGAAARRAGKRVLLDAVSAFGAWPFRLADHPEVDAITFTPNKCLEGLPGCGFAVCPVEHTRARLGQAGSWSLDLADVLLRAERNGSGSSRFTPAPQVLRAFGVAMRLYEEEGGQPARLARYRENMRILREGMEALGLRPYLAVEHQGPIIGTFHQPGGGFELQRFVDALKRRGVLISNFYNTEEPTFRVGCIGAVTPDDMRRAVSAMGDALRELDALPHTA